MGYGFQGSAFSGTIAAATSGTLWTYEHRLADTGVDSGQLIEVRRLHVHVVTIAAFSTLVTAGRALRLVRGAADSAHTVAVSGGAGWDAARKYSADSLETLGVGRIATTVALTTTGYTFGSIVRRRMSLVHLGAAGSPHDEVWKFDGLEAEPIFLRPGQVLAIQTDAALDAGGTIQLKVDADVRLRLAADVEA